MGHENLGRRSRRAAAQRLLNLRDITATPRRRRTLPDVTGSCMPGLAAFLAVLAAQPAPAADFTGTAGAGGVGGSALEVTAGTAFTNALGSVVGGGAGGDGGSGGSGGNDGTVGQGGAGVVMAGNGQTLVNGGLIAGGLDGNGSVGARAVTITGNDNRLELQPGGSFEGEIVATGTDNAFLLGGSSTGEFDNDALRSSLQGFASFQKTDTGTWSLTGSDSQAWTVAQGTLKVAGSVGSATVTGGRIGGTGRLGSLTMGSGRSRLAIRSGR